jgi:hypothetical protein
MHNCVDCKHCVKWSITDDDSSSSFVIVPDLLFCRERGYTERLRGFPFVNTDCAKWHAKA